MNPSFFPQNSPIPDQRIPASPSKGRYQAPGQSPAETHKQETIRQMDLVGDESLLGMAVLSVLSSGRVVRPVTWMIWVVCVSRMELIWGDGQQESEMPCSSSKEDAKWSQPGWPLKEIQWFCWHHGDLPT
ncbi:hypothetical protein P7K49_020238 [Saguinus oedipus]|uniref:Uncharacterized protein n=1 Tax=Saguinus oedipus TaxID=9490 RepID=A0ABQ9UZY5_SAGOE|nr:hypothetical protein P7K49_020238 [Saguinus oedipus]